MDGRPGLAGDVSLGTAGGGACWEAFFDADCAGRATSSTTGVARSQMMALSSNAPRVSTTPTMSVRPWVSHDCRASGASTGKVSKHRRQWPRPDFMRDPQFGQTT